jgi:hypothetical protein
MTAIILSVVAWVAKARFSAMLGCTQVCVKHMDCVLPSGQDAKRFLPRSASRTAADDA